MPARDCSCSAQRQRSRSYSRPQPSLRESTTKPSGHRRQPTRRKCRSAIRHCPSRSSHCRPNCLRQSCRNGPFGDQGLSGVQTHALLVGAACYAGAAPNNRYRARRLRPPPLPRAPRPRQFVRLRLATRRRLGPSTRSLRFDERRPPSFNQERLPRCLHTNLHGSASCGAT